MDKKLEENLSRFKRVREAMIHADSNELEHHLKAFVREIRGNELLAQVLPQEDAFDVDTWWVGQTGDPRQYTRISSIEFPDDENERLVALLDLAESMASGDAKQLDINGFGHLFGKTKTQDAVPLVVNIVLRPLAQILSDRIRRQVEVANPAIRELAGVPLTRIPNDDEIRIFLSHKTVDKPMVQRYHSLLEELGLSPWLDSHDMRVGDVVHRGITEGLDHACAVVFFITKNFRDERWLAHEIDQAVNRKIDRGDRFAIITLVFEGAEDVPRPLRNYIYHEVKDEITSAREIVRALPIVVGPPRWRE